MFDLSKYYIEYGGSNGSFFKRNVYIQLCDPCFQLKANSFFQQYNKDCYQCMYAYENLENIDNCKLYSNLYFDLDGDIHTKKGYIELRKDVTMLVSYFKSIGLSDEEMELYFSGSKGFHFVVPASILAIEPSTNLNLLYKAWASYFYNVFNIKTIDLVIYDRKRLFRIPNTINSKTGLKKTRIFFKLLWLADTYEDFLKLITEKDFSYLKTSKNINKEAAIFFYNKSQNFYRNQGSYIISQNTKPFEIPETKTDLLPCVKCGLENGAAKGCRNNTLVALSSSIMQSGYKLEETLSLMHDWNDNNEEPLSFNEIEFTVRSAYSMLLNGKKYGCGALKDIGLCIDEKNCRIKKERQERASG